MPRKASTDIALWNVECEIKVVWDFSEGEIHSPFIPISSSSSFVGPLGNFPNYNCEYKQTDGQTGYAIWI